MADTPHPPAADATAIELPYRLTMTPIGTPGWRHAGRPVEARGRTELWHTRLEDPADRRGPAGRFRFLWSPDVGRGDKEPAFRMSLDRQDRDFLVGLTADWRLVQPSGTPYLPRSAEARRLHLSSLGALLDAGGDWEPRPAGIDLEQWRHRMSLGREHYVRLVYAGFLLPFGHAASLVKVTERRFCELPGGGRSAVLRQRYFVILREHVRHYDQASFPFSEVEIVTEVTPPLVVPDKDPARLVEVAGQAVLGKVQGVSITPRMAFWPAVEGGKGNALFSFEAAATDRDGQKVAFSMPMLFVSEIVNRKRDEAVRAAYNVAAVSQRQASMGGVPLRFDPEPGESRLPAGRMQFVVGSFSAKNALDVRFHPEMEEADVRVPAIDRLLGRRIEVAMRYPKGKDEEGNAGEIFLLAARDPLALSFGGGVSKAQTDALGGLGAPEMRIYGLSKLSGPVAGQPGTNAPAALAKALGNSFDPGDFFPLDAKLIGGVALRDIVKAGSSALDGATAPRMLSASFPTGSRRASRGAPRSWMPNPPG